MTAYDGLPAGTVIAFGGDPAQAVSNGPWLLCDGKVYLQSQYTTLFAAIQNLYGGSPIGGTFAVPDCRGIFLRGADRGTGRDPDAASRALVNNAINIGVAPANYPNNMPGTVQGAATARPYAPNAFAMSVGNMIIDQHSSLGATTSSPSANNASEQNVPLSGGDGDTRPANVYVQYLIKTSTD